MYAIDHEDLGTPASRAEDSVTVRIDGAPVTVPAGTSILRAAALAGSRIPKLCATDTLKAFGSCRLCLVEIEGRKGYPASCTTQVVDGMSVRTRTEKLAQLRKGVMELYVSDHPLDCEGCPADTHCELQDMAAVVGVRDTPYAAGGAVHRGAARDVSNPYFTFNPDLCIVCSRCVRACDETQGTLALTVASRGFGSRIAASQDEPFLDVRMRVLRRLRRGLPDGGAFREDARRGRAAGPHRDDDLRVLRRRLFAQCRGPGRCGRADGARPPGWRKRGPRLRQGAVRLRLRHARRPGHDTDDPPQDHGSLAPRELGGRDRACGARVQAPAGEVRPGLDRRHHIVALHQRGDLPRAEARACGFRQQQRRHLRPRLPLARPATAQAHAGRIRGHAGVHVGHEVRRDHADRRQRHRRAPGVRLAAQAPPARGREADRGRPARHRYRAHAARRGQPPPAVEARHQRRGHERDRARDRDGGTREGGVRAQPLRAGNLASMEEPSSPGRTTLPKRCRTVTRRARGRAARGGAALCRGGECGDLLRTRRDRAQPGHLDGDGDREPRHGDRQLRPRRRRREPAARPEQRPGVLRHGLVPA